MNPNTFQIDAFWDAEVAVWVATSDRCAWTGNRSRFLGCLTTKTAGDGSRTVNAESGQKLTHSACHSFRMRSRSAFSSAKAALH